MIILAIIHYVLVAFWFLLLIRSSVELIQGIWPHWRPRGILVVLLELVFVMTDPPVNLFRRIIPTVNFGTVRVDVSLMVLLMAVVLALKIVS